MYWISSGGTGASDQRKLDSISASLVGVAQSGESELSMKGTPMMMLLVLFLTLLELPALAQEKAKGPSCQEQLQEEQVRAQNLSQDRDNKERMVARIQAIAMNLQQQIGHLQKQLADLKKTDEPKGEK